MSSSLPFVEDVKAVYNAGSMSMVGKTFLTSDRGVLKTNVRDGSGDRVGPNSKVQIHYLMRILDGQLLSDTRERGKPIEFNLGKGATLPGMEIAVSSMCIGEYAFFLLHPSYAFGRYGQYPIVPGNAYIELEVEVISCDGISADPLSDLKSVEECFKVASLEKEVANSFYKDGELKKAIRHYNKGIAYLKQWKNKPTDNQSLKENLRSLLGTFLMNRAAVLLKLKSYEKVIRDCTEALTFLPENPKALFRRAQAMAELRDYVNAFEDLDTVLEKDPKNSEVRRLKLRVEKDFKAYKLATQKAYAGFLLE